MRRLLIGLVLGVPMGCSTSTLHPPSPSVLRQESLEKEDKGRLEMFEDSLSDQDDESSYRSRRKRHQDEDENDSFLAVVLGAIFSDFFSVFLSLPFQDFGVRYGDRPYAKGLSGLRTKVEDPRLEGQLLSFQASGFSHRVDSDLVGYGVDARLRFPSSFSLGFDWTHYTEELGGNDDNLNLWNIDLSLAIPILTNFNLDLGGGAGGIVGDDSDFGGSYGLGAQWYPLSPLVLEGSAKRTHFDAGVLNDLQIGGGILLDRFQFSLGYRGLVSPGQNLGGPQVSISIWF